MPKRVGFLYERMADKELIRVAILKGSKGKRRRHDVKRVLADVDKYVDKTYEIIVNRSYIPTQPKQKTVYDASAQKYRIVYVVPFFPDGILQQLEVMVMQPILMRGMHPCSCASIPGRGGKRALNKAVKCIQGDPKGSKYCAELDVKSFYPTIPMRGVVSALERKIKDREFVCMVMVTITCFPGGMPEVKRRQMMAVQITNDMVGLMIGFYINQWIANFYLESVDHVAMSEKGVKYEIRYMDNFTLFGPNKKKLHEAVRNINFAMKRKGLTLKHTWQVYPVKSRMVSIVGYRIDKDHVILRKRNFLRFCQQCRRVMKRKRANLPISYRQASGLMSRIGQLRHCNSYTIREKYVDPIQIKTLKEVIRRESKRRLAAQRGIQCGTAA